jgi:regulator of PEP synthase PpsR (kinase-PPPase family)
MSPTHAIILAISDATGETSEQAGKAALAQFGLQEQGTVRTVSNIRTVSALEEVMRKAKEIHALVVYTLVDRTLRHAVRDLAERHDVTAVDLIGGLIRGLAQHLGQAPLSVPGLGHELSEEYFRRIAAVEFTVNQDDGKNPQNLHRADIVLVGISRTSKTPLSNYLAHRGLKVANVPIVQDVPLPRELESVDPRRVFALGLNAVTLQNIRQTRMEKLRMKPGSDYGDLRQIRREIGYARRLFDQHPEWTQVDVSRKAVEESAATVIEIYRDHFEKDEDDAPAPKKTRGKKAARRKKAKKPAAPKKGARKTAPKKASTKAHAASRKKS